MNVKSLQKLARDPRLISGIYNYCDRWCERCSFTNRCLNYAMQLEEWDPDDAASRDITNEKFWKKLEQQFRDTVEMIRESAKECGGALDDRALLAEEEAQERRERLDLENHSLTVAAMEYLKATDKWFKEAEAAFHAKGVELETMARIETGDPENEAAELQDWVEVVRWYQQFIFVKFSRAIGSQANERAEKDEELRAFPKDSDGSAKIALIAVDRSIAAWSGLRATLCHDEKDETLNLLVQLTAIRRQAERHFPKARAFVRPGFDE